MLAQHHDHAGTSEARIAAYDAAGYHVIGLQHYSGNPSLSYAWTERRWPAEEWLSSAFLLRLRNIRLFVPNAEEVGAPQTHFTSPFLTTYIEGAPEGSALAPHQYTDAQGLIRLIAVNGGVPCLAHPWTPNLDVSQWENVPCVEIYNAFAEAKREQGAAGFASTDANAQLVANWDRFLRVRPRTLGIAVNDHFGPQVSDPSVSAAVRDSGKILVLAPEIALTAYERAFRTGAFFAIRELTPIKGAHPIVTRLSVTEQSISLVLADPTDAVAWIANGARIAETPVLPQSQIPPGSAYIRAEVRRGAAFTLYTQAFEVRQTGDNDGDGDVDDNDATVCERVRAGADTQREHVAACAR